MQCLTPVGSVPVRRIQTVTKMCIRDRSYSYEYSFDGKNYTEIPGTLDAAVLSDDYVLQSYGGFFTGAFVGMACVDYSGYDQTAEFRSFDYKELD